MGDQRDGERQDEQHRGGGDRGRDALGEQVAYAAYTAEPGSKSAEALSLLGSWAATLDQAQTAHATDEA